MCIYIQALVGLINSHGDRVLQSLMFPMYLGTKVPLQVPVILSPIV
jgi:hypothetical protein